VIDWAARARVQLALCGPGGTVKTDETPVSSVSSVPSAGAVRKRELVSSVLSVVSPVPDVIGRSADRAIDTAAANDACVAGRSSAPARSIDNPYMTSEQGDECHACGWNDAEIARFLERVRRFAVRSRKDAQHLAERLTLRDRQVDDRRFCLECQELEVSGRCAAARRGAIHGADRRLEPVQNILMRCPSFKNTERTLVPVAQRR
jgi:hypothetical protein